MLLTLVFLVFISYFCESDHKMNDHRYQDQTKHKGHDRACRCTGYRAINERSEDSYDRNNSYPCKCAFQINTSFKLYPLYLMTFQLKRVEKQGKTVKNFKIAYDSCLNIEGDTARMVYCG